MPSSPTRPGRPAVPGSRRPSSAPLADPARAAATQTVSRWSLTAAGTAIPAGTVSRDSAPAGQLTVAPDGRFLARGAPPGGDAVSLSVLP